MIRAKVMGILHKLKWLDLETVSCRILLCLLKLTEIEIQVVICVTGKEVTSLNMDSYEHLLLIATRFITIYCLYMNLKRHHIMRLTEERYLQVLVLFLYSST